MGACFSQVHPDKKGFWYHHYFNSITYHNRNNFHKIPVKYIDVDMCKRAINHGASIDFIPKHLYGDELFVYLVKHHLFHIEDIPKEHITCVVVEAFVSHRTFIEEIKCFNFDMSKHKYLKYVDFSVNGVTDMFFDKFRKYTNECGDCCSMIELFRAIPIQYHTWYMYEWVDNHLSEWRDNYAYEPENNRKVKLSKLPKNWSIFYSYLCSAIFKDNGLDDRPIDTQEDAELLFKSCIDSKKYYMFYDLCFKMIPLSLKTPYIYECCMAKDYINITCVPNKFYGKFTLDFVYRLGNTILHNHKYQYLNYLFKLVPSDHPEIGKLDILVVSQYTPALEIIPKERQTSSFFSAVMANLNYNQKYINFELLPNQFKTLDFYKNFLNQNIAEWRCLLKNDTTNLLFTDEVYNKIIDWAIETGNIEGIYKIPSHLLTEDIYQRILDQKWYFNKPSYIYILNFFFSEQIPKKIYLKILSQIFENDDKEIFNCSIYLDEFKKVFSDDEAVLQNIILFRNGYKINK
jgi:hypothetical protein